MNRRNFVGLLAASTVAAIIPVKAFAPRIQFTGETFPHEGRSLLVGIDFTEEGCHPISPTNFPELERQLIGRNVQPHMRVRFQGTINPLRLVNVQRIA